MVLAKLVPMCVPGVAHIERICISYFSIFYTSSFQPTLMFLYQDGMEQWQDLGGRGLKFIDVRPGRGLGEIPTTYKN